jgi:extracellular elastinolytic metalloproteinase
VSVQDSSGVDNANFATPPDGQTGQMRMFTWTKTTPQRDGALANDIIVHEFTHGVSNRLTGGGTGMCLQTTEAGGMGEGWSDAMADITECKSNPVPDFTLGSYVFNTPGGIRSYPYSTSMTTNPLTYSSLQSRNEGKALLLSAILVEFNENQSMTLARSGRSCYTSYWPPLLT